MSIRQIVCDLSRSPYDHQRSSSESHWLVTPQCEATVESNCAVWVHCHGPICLYLLMIKACFIWKTKIVDYFQDLCSITYPTYTSKGLKYLTFIAKFLFHRNMVPVWAWHYQIISTIYYIIEVEFCSLQLLVLLLINSTILFLIVAWVLIELPYGLPFIECLDKILDNIGFEMDFRDFKIYVKEYYINQQLLTLAAW